MIINLKSSNDFSGFYIIYDGSTNYEDAGTRGITHLIEHLICKSFQDLRNDFQKYAIDWNATTTTNNISFYFTGLESGLAKFRNKLVDRITTFDVTKKDFELERMIVLEEYTDAFNKQPLKHLNNIYRKYLDNFCPIGNKKDIQELKFLDVLRFYEKHLLKPTKIINVSKNRWVDESIDFENTQIEKRYELKEYGNPLEYSQKNAEKNSIILMTQLQQNDVNILKFISKLLGLGLESPLYQEVREKKGLCYSITCDTDRFNKQSLLKIQTITGKDRDKKVIDIVKNILNKPEKFISKERFNIIKNNLLNQKIKEDLNRYLFVQDEMNPPEFSIYKDLEKLTYSKVISTYEKMIDVDKMVVSSDKEFAK